METKETIDEVKELLKQLDNVELIMPDEEDYKLIEETKGEESVSLDEFLKL